MASHFITILLSCWHLERMEPTMEQGTITIRLRGEKEDIERIASPLFDLLAREQHVIEHSRLVTTSIDWSGTAPVTT